MVKQKAPLTARDIERVYYKTYRAGPWNQPEKRIVQRELMDACWQSVLDAVRAESAAEIERLAQRVKDLEAITIAAVEAHA